MKREEMEKKNEWSESSTWKPHSRTSRGDQAPKFHLEKRASKQATMWSNSNLILLEGLTTESTKKMISLATKRNTADKGSPRRIYRRDQHFNEARKR